MTDRRIQGARAKAQGAAFEDRLLRSFHWYAAHGLAAIDKTPEPMKPIRRLGDGRYIAVFTRTGQVDFSGTLPGGISVRLEAKYTTTDRITQDRVTRDEAADMDLHAGLGANCFVICGFSSGNVYLVPWGIWKDMRDHYGRRYVKEADLGDPVPTFGPGLLDVLGLAVPNLQEKRKGRNHGKV